ncbi:MAG: tryptophan synthase subunit alpha [Kordiimonadales bacterium]|nr:MAG: tryptophan synthase subunit alpha [Kordiimonadales bacterium]
MSRLQPCFAALKAKNEAAFVTYIQAGDPSLEVSSQILHGMPAAGASIIELGMPFSDPAADGPAIDKAAQRALKAGASMKQTLQMVRDFRKGNDNTPIVLMGYFNPVYRYGIDKFCADASEAGVDGLIIVDLPPEEDAELRIPAAERNIDVIRLATPTSDDARLPTVLNGASGFVYYVAVAGTTGSKSAATSEIAEAVGRIKASTDLPVAVGFGIRTPEQAAAVASVADGAVVGTAIIEIIEKNIEADGTVRPGLAEEVLDFTRNLADGVKSVRVEGKGNTL